MYMHWCMYIVYMYEYVCMCVVYTVKYMPARLVQIYRIIRIFELEDSGYLPFENATYF